MTLNSVLIFSVLVMFSPLNSVLWIGSVVTTFVGAVFFLTVGWVISNTSAPAYFINMGTGELKWNVISHIWLGVLNLVFGFILGEFLGGFYVIIGTSLSIILSSWQLIAKFNQANGIKRGSLLDGPERVFVWLLVIEVLLSVLYFWKSDGKGMIPFYSILSLILLGTFLWGLKKVRSLADLYMAIPKILLKLQ